MKENWQPSALINSLQSRAKIMQQIRDFFAARKVLEVETPLMGRATGTDSNIESISTSFQYFGEQAITCYLQTSPEFAMKRLLAAGSGDIYQICKSFRNGEVGQIHNPEFTMLEWYRVGFDHHQLMQEVEDLIKFILNCDDAEKFTYQEVFLKFLQIDPFTATIDELKNCVAQQNLQADLELTRDGWLNLLMSHFIEPKLGQKVPTFIYDFPASQAALALINKDNPLVADRFEVYAKGMELANGFNELLNADEQRKRFLNDLKYRTENNLALYPIDEYFLSALEAGLPNCAGVALGVDRLILLALEKLSIQEVVSFDFSRV